MALNWMDNRVSQVVEEVNGHYSKFRISDVVMTCYKFAWNDFCSWYLEAVKPNYQELIDSKTLERVIDHFETLLKLLHPLMPFITEEMWDLLRERESPQDRVVVAHWPLVTAYDKPLIDGFSRATELTSQVRNIRKQNNIPNKIMVDLFIRNDEESDQQFYPLLKKLANIETCHRDEDMPAEAFTFVIGRAEYAVPYGEEVDVEGQVDKMREELTYTRGFLKSVQKKLSNERFVNNAPEQVVQVEKTKEADALAKIALIEEKLTAMGVEF